MTQKVGCCQWQVTSLAGIIFSPQWELALVKSKNHRVWERRWRHHQPGNVHTFWRTQRHEHQHLARVKTKQTIRRPILVGNTSCRHSYERLTSWSIQSPLKVTRSHKCRDIQSTHTCFHLKIQSTLIDKRERIIFDYPRDPTWTIPRIGASSH